MSLLAYRLQSGFLTELNTLFTPSHGSMIWPNAGSTGVQSSITLTPYSGGATIPQGTYENLLFTDNGGGYTFLASQNTIVRNCRFEVGVTFQSCDNLLVEFCEMPGISFSSCHGVIARTLHVFDTPGDFIDVTGDATNRPDNRCLDIVIEDCYLHSPQPSPTAHTDGIQTRGVQGLTIRNCSIDLGTFQSQHNAALFFENANGGTTDLLVSGCYLNGGPITARFNNINGSFKVTDNQFGPDATITLYTMTAPLPIRQANNFDSNNQPVTFAVNI